MKKNILFAVLFLSLVLLAGCGSSPTSSSSSSSNPIHDAITSDPTLFDVFTSDTTFNTSSQSPAFTIMSPIRRCYSWYRTFNALSPISFADISMEALTAEVFVSRTVSGILYVKMSLPSDSTTSESFKQDFARYVSLSKASGSWKITQITQGISKSFSDFSMPFSSEASDVTIDSVSISDISPSGISTYDALTGDPTAEGPWIDYSNIFSAAPGDTLEVTITTANSYFVFIWPDFSATSSGDWFFRHQIAGTTSPYSFSFRVPANENAGRKRMTIGAFDLNTLASNEAPLFGGPYDFTSWHIPYKVE